MPIDPIAKYGFKPDGTDNSAAFSKMHDDLATFEAENVPMPQVDFAEGRYFYSVAPNFGIQNLDIRGHGQVEWVHTGSGDAFIMNGGQNGKFNLTVDNIRFVPGNQTANVLVLTFIHHSNFRIKVYGAQPGRRALSLMGCVCSDFHQYTCTPFDGGHSYDCFGAWLDTHGGGQTTDCAFYSPIIEVVRVGMWLQDAGGCDIFSGTIEGCTDRGIHIETGGQNHADGVWLENNSNFDVSFGSGAKNNRLYVKHPSKLKVSGNSWLRNNTVVDSVSALT